MNKKHLIIGIIIIAAAVALAVVSYFILPDSVAVQISVSGEASTYLPKLAALAIPFAISGAFSFLYIKNGSEKSLLVALVGLVLSVVTIIVNR